MGNLDLQVTEELVMAMFGQMGTVRSCKIIREPANINAEPYGFVEFADHSAAAVSMNTKLKRMQVITAIYF